MKKIKKLISMLTLVAFLGMPISSISAYENPSPTIIQDNANVDLFNVLNRYFESRTLLDATDIMNNLTGIVFDEMILDEIKRSNRLTSASVIGIDNDYIINDYQIYEYYGIVLVAEHITYILSDVTISETVTHTITYTFNTNLTKFEIANSNYVESFINFESCAYVPPAAVTSIPTIKSNDSIRLTNGVDLTCNQIENLIQIALQEIGYIEKATCNYLNDKYANPRTNSEDNHTKFGQWHSSCAAWCVMFVAWCADQAQISTNIIPKTQWGNVLNFQTLLIQQGGVYHPKLNSNGDYYIPQPGDIFFMKSSSGNHTGIVVSTNVTSTKTQMWVIDGNWSDQVSYRSYNLTDPLFVGYVTPAYTTPSQITDDSMHNYVCSDHSASTLHTCSTCGKETIGNIISDHDNSMEHSCTLCSERLIAIWQGDHTQSLNHTCSLCGYVKEGHSECIGYAHDPSIHWLTCSECNDSWNEGIHMWSAINGGQDGYNCRICGRYTLFITLNSKVTPIILLLN